MRAPLAALALATLGAGAVPAAARSAHAPTLTETNRAIVTNFARLFYTQRDVRGAFARYVAPGYVQHNPGLPDGRDAAIAMLTGLFGAPGATFEVKRIVVDSDLAAVHVHGRPDPATKGVAVVDIYRLAGGKIVEHWDVVQAVPDAAASSHPMF